MKNKDFNSKDKAEGSSTQKDSSYNKGASSAKNTEVPSQGKNTQTNSRDYKRASETESDISDVDSRSASTDVNTGKRGLSDSSTASKSGKSWDQQNVDQETATPIKRAKGSISDSGETEAFEDVDDLDSDSSSSHSEDDSRSMHLSEDEEQESVEDVDADDENKRSY